MSDLYRAFRRALHAAIRAWHEERKWQRSPKDEF